MIHNLLDTYYKHAEAETSNIILCKYNVWMVFVLFKIFSIQSDVLHRDLADKCNKGRRVIEL
jgi:hypothetical protein